MSATREPDLASGEESGADREASCDPGVLGDDSVPAEQTGAGGAIALLPVGAAVQSGGQQVAYPAVEEDRNIQLVQEKQENKEGEEEDSQEVARAASGSCPEGTAVNAEAECKTGYYFEEASTVRSLSFLAKKALLRHYLRLIGEYYEPEGEEQEEEKNKHGKPEEGPKM